jgi:hypothetical protein
MSTSVDPRIVAKLTAFAQRRRKLIILRGICAGIGMLLATMMLVALLDLIFVLPDEARWGLSAAAYLAVLVAEWRTCLRLLAHAPGPRRLARLLEHAEPKLREDLLSAVELGSNADQAIFDSARFRQLVQSDVAARMEGLDVERLLPVQLVRRSLGVAAAVVVALCLAFIFTGSQVGTLLVRALLPMANLARVSRYKVEIVEPRNPEQMVPHGETVPLRVKISGGHTQKAILETFTAAGGRDVVQMTPDGADTFTAAIQVAREDVKYRIRAGDAITRKYRLDAEARPHVALFRKLYTYPAYTRWDAKAVTEETGDLAGLEGSQVTVSVETNQPIAHGELRVEQGKKSFAVPLQPEATNEKNNSTRLTATMPLEASGTYRVHLLAQRTGFENKFSPEYEIRAQPDLVPDIALEAPQQDLILPANESVDIEGHASDDQALASVVQLVRVNEGLWQEIVLATDPGAKVNVARRWDLFEQGVKAGDLLTCKLRATDRKGSIAESRAFQVSVTRAGFESKRLQTLAVQRGTFELLKQLRTASEKFEKAGRDLQESFARLPENDPQRRLAVVTAKAAHAEWNVVAEETYPQLLNALRAAATAHESAGLVLVGRLLGRMQKSAGNEARDALGILEADPSAKSANGQADLFAGAASRALQRARLAEDSFEKFLGAEELDVLTENAQIVAREQQRIVALAANSGKDPLRWASVGKRLRVVASELRSLEEFMKAAAPHLPGGYADRLLRHQTNITRQRTALDQSLAKTDGNTSLMEPSKALAKFTNDVWRELLAFERETVAHPVQAATQILAEVQPTYANLEKLLRDLHGVAEAEALPDATRSQLRDWKWASRIAHFKLHGDLEEARPASDAPFVSDVRAATLALDALSEKQRDLSLEAVDAQIRVIDEKFRFLEVAHNIAEVALGLEGLATAERWEFVSPRARTTQPRDWEWFEARLKSLPEELGRLGVADPARKIVADAQKLLRTAANLPAAQRVNKEMKERFQFAREPVSVAADAQEVAQSVMQALQLLRTPIDEAREQLAALAPKLHEMMAQLAARTEELKKQTNAQAEKTAQQKPEEAQPEAAQTLARQEALNEKVETLKDALRSEANKQNILEADGREKARDVDDALAMLKEPPPRAAQALTKASQSSEAAPRREQLQNAVAEQQKLAQSLEQLAEHFENAANGDAAKSRLALRATEEQTGVKEALDAQYARAEQLAQLAQAPPEDLLAQLERALPQNPVMQKELDSISANLLASAEQRLSQASQQENEVASKVADEVTRQNQMQRQAATTAAQAARQAAQAANSAKQAATNAREQAKDAANESALQQAQSAIDQATAAANSAEQAARAADEAGRLIDTAKMAPAAQSAQQAAAQAAEAANAAAQAATDARQAQNDAQQAEQSGGEKVANNRQSAQQAREAAKSADAAAKAARTAQAAAEQIAAAANANQTAPSPANNPQLAQNAAMQTPIGAATREAGENVTRAGRHEMRLQNSTAAEQLDALGQEIVETATGEVPAAAQALTQAQSAMQAQPAVNAAKNELATELGQLQSAANSGNGAQPSAQSPANAAAPQPSVGATPPASSAAQANGATPASAPQSTSPPQTAANAPAQNAGSGQPPSPGAMPGENATASAQGQPAPGTPQGAPGQNGTPAQTGQNNVATAPASPQQQVWMARTLDALDAALHGTAPSENGQSAQNGKPANGKAPGQQSAPGGPGQQAPPSLANAQSAMNAAAQAAAAAMRGARASDSSPTPAGDVSMSEALAKSKGGVSPDGNGLPYAAPPDAKTIASGDWGKLPKKLAEELTQGQRENVAGEYREQIETYYRVIAEKSKAP